MMGEASTAALRAGSPALDVGGAAAAGPGDTGGPAAGRTGGSRRMNRKTRSVAAATERGRSQPLFRRCRSFDMTRARTAA